MYTDQDIVSFLGHPNTIGIIGYGVEGRSSHLHLRRIFPLVKIVVMDQSTEIDLVDKSGTVTRTGMNYLAGLSECDVVLRSPGVKLTGVPSSVRVTSQVDIFTNIAKSKIIGVTGTKGKSTTTALIYHLISHKYKTALVGNIGVPALDCLTGDYDYFVCEYSCHQLSDITASPSRAILLNLFPEHLDYYNSVEAYYETKSNIYKYQDDGELLLAIPELGIAKSQDISFGKNIETSPNTVIKADSDKMVIAGKEVTYSPALKGEHNKVNQLFATVIAAELGLSVQEIAEKLAIFQGLPHRLETVFEIEGLRFINDSISTTPQSTIAAINSFEEVAAVIIGGYDRGIDYAPLVEYLNSDINYDVILFSDVGARIANSLSVEYKNYSTFEEAISAALEAKYKEGTVIMSPAASSYDEFRSFVQRGEKYKALVLNYFK